MNEQQNISAWQLVEDSAAAYEQYLVGRFFRRWAGRLVAHAGIDKEKRVLDAGCGTGIVARTVARSNPGTAVVGLDPNEGMLTEARRRNGAETITWKAGSLESLPFDDGDFDLILSQQVLQFVPDRASALSEIHRTLAPGGRFVFALLRNIRFHPSYDALAAVLDRHAGQAVGDMMRAPFSGPDADTLRQELKHAGFHDIHIQHDILDVRFPDPKAYLTEEAASSPLAEPISQLDAGTQSNLLADLTTALEAFTDDEGILFPMETCFVQAWR